MKKILMGLAVLILTVGTANAALSGVQLSVEGVTDGPGNVTEKEIEICHEITIDVHGPAAYDWAGYIIIEGIFPGSGGEWGDDLGPPYEPLNSGYYYEKIGGAVAEPGAGDLAVLNRYEEVDWGFGYEIGAAISEGDLPGGLQYTFTYHCVGPYCEYVTISLWDDGVGYEPGDVQDTIVIHQVPEPMTMCLLGLGGLLLRRRK